ncbi:glutathione transferase GstA [Pseudomonas sp. N040]|uniref:glutathione transferase GstA n=1 Tax=Pseudomonas sp. N040 TaxID=2785325 RepID=UPI0018A2E126|nr:glutathione transferase GstA [Pseudomonas sp. N040]MBF7730975.1 glutathione transferase GstA [Pseudomonas sp. N040]MBW7014618.1 glutathione transferase GstA [Pseudomonas sp. N040]
MKLYYSPGACSLSPHIALEESGLAYEAIAAPTKTHQLADGTDYYSINPLGYVPLLVLDDGRQLREGPAIVQYIADQVPARHLAPANGTFERAKLQEWLNFIGTELHKGFSPLFNPATPAEYKTMLIAKLGERLKFTDGLLAGQQFVLGDTFSVADGYLFTVTNWAQPLGIDLAPYANLVAYRSRVAARPAVRAAMQAEGLIK